MHKRTLTVIVIVIFIGFIHSCKKDPPFPTGETPDPTNPADTGNGEYSPTPYVFDMGQYGNDFPPFQIPADNPMTKEGIELGRHLFYEKMLSGDNSLSCGGCHKQRASFVDDDKPLSEGVNGALGFRNAMPLYNLMWMENGLFWDGKARNLEELVIFPVTRKFEMHEDIYAAMDELRATEKYPEMFGAAFGTQEVNVDRTVKAISQFLRTIIAYSPKWDPTRDDLLTAQELRGREVFLDENKGDCFHCHTLGTPLLTTEEFLNNGSVANVAEDPGLMSQTGQPQDAGKFKVPSLLNLKYTAPYFHDGRFNTLEEVLDFYDTGFHSQKYLDKNLVKHLGPDQVTPIPREWSEQDKEDLIAFLLALEDKSIIEDEAFSNPNE